MTVDTRRSYLLGPGTDARPPAIIHRHWRRHDGVILRQIRPVQPLGSTGPASVFSISNRFIFFSCPGPRARGTIAQHRPCVNLASSSPPPQRTARFFLLGAGPRWVGGGVTMASGKSVECDAGNEGSTVRPRSRRMEMAANRVSEQTSDIGLLDCVGAGWGIRPADLPIARPQEIYAPARGPILSIIPSGTGMDAGGSERT